MVTIEAEPVFVDARFAGGPIEVSQGTYIDEQRLFVLLQIPGANAVPLFPAEARALAAALTTAASAATQKNAPDSAATEFEGETESQEENQS